MVWKPLIDKSLESNMLWWFKNVGWGDDLRKMNCIPKPVIINWSNSGLYTPQTHIYCQLQTTVNWVKSMGRQSISLSIHLSICVHPPSRRSICPSVFIHPGTCQSAHPSVFNPIYNLVIRAVFYNGSINVPNSIIYVWMSNCMFMLSVPLNQSKCHLCLLLHCHV